MKTSNKLLLGALGFIILGMIAANFYFKSQVDENKSKYLQIKTIDDLDSLQVDTIHKTIQIKIN